MPPELRQTFDQSASTYLSARPNYPDQLFDDLVSLTRVQPPARLLEVGCGPGQATIPLARRGFRINAIELGASLAAEARRNLSSFPLASVEVGDFDTWKLPPVRFDLMYAATAWHWLNPETRFAKAAVALRPAGHLAIWGAGHAFPSDYDRFFEDIQRVYEEIGEDKPGDEWPPPLPEEQPDESPAFEESGLFEVVAVRRYLWGLRYTADEYIALLDTFSGHIAMEPAKREYLYSEIRRRIAERPDGQVLRHWSSVLTIGREAS